MGDFQCHLVGIDVQFDQKINGEIDRNVTKNMK